METKQLNNDKQLRLQELVKTTRDIYTRGIKTQFLSGVIAAFALGAVIYFLDVEEPLLKWKMAADPAVVLIILASTWYTVKSYSRLSKASGAEELIRLHTENKKQSTVLNSVFFLLLSAALVVLHYDGTLLSLIGGAIFWLIIGVIAIWASRRDCKEIKEIKELMQEN